MLKNSSVNQDPTYDAEAAVELAIQPTDELRLPAGLPTHLPLWRMVLVLAWWPLLEQLMGAMIGFVDTALAGRITAEATAAIGTAGYMLWLMGILQGAVGIGSTAIIARAIGARRTNEAELAVGQSILLAVVWGSINVALFWFAAPLVGKITSLSVESQHLCTMYLRLLALVAPCRAVLFIGGACLRGAGDMRSPFWVMVLVNLVNVIASVSLVLVGWGLRGVALGTVMAWVVGLVAMGWLLIHGRGGIALHTRYLKPVASMTRRLIRLSVPAVLENGGNWFGNILVIVLVGYLAKLGLNEHPMGSQIIAVRIEAFSFLLGFGFATAAATIVGQYLGAGDRRRAKHAAWIAFAYSAIIMGAFGVLFMTIPHYLVRILTNQQPFLTDVPPMLFQAGWAQIGFASCLVMSGALRGAGDVRTTMWITFFGTFAVRLPLVWWFGIHLRMGLTGVWIVLAAELMIRGAMFVARFLHGGWLRAKV